MTQPDIVEAVLDAIRARNRVSPEGSQLACAADALLFAPGSPLDSLGLVALLIDVEDNISSRAGVALTLSDERAMSRTRSPFHDVATLVSFIEDRLKESVQPS